LKKKGQSQIAQQMQAAGPGARGIVYGSRANGTGHVFNVANQKGKVNFVDFQSGGAASFEGFDTFLLLRTN